MVKDESSIFGFSSEIPRELIKTQPHLGRSSFFALPEPPRPPPSSFWPSRKPAFSHTIHVPTEKMHVVLGKLHNFLGDFNQNRFWTHRGQFSADFGARRLNLHRRHCIWRFARVRDRKRSIKTVWVDEIVWEDLAWTDFWVITLGTPEA